MNNSEKAYRELLQNSLNRITDEIALLESQNNGLISVVTKTQKRIEKLKVEQQHLQAELTARINKNQELEPGAIVGSLDGKIKDNVQKLKMKQARIGELESLNSTISSKIGHRIMDRRIMRATRKMQNQQCRINLLSNIQKALLLPKYIVEKFRLGRYSKKEGNVSYYENKLAETTAKTQKLQPEIHLLDNIKAKYYDIKGKYYAKKLERAQEKLRKLQEKGVQNKVLGANAVAMSKEDTDKLRQRMKQQQEQVTQQQEQVTQQQEQVTQQQEQVTQQQEQVTQQQEQVTQQQKQEAQQQTSDINQSSPIIIPGPQPNPDAKIVMPGPQPNPDAKIVMPGPQPNPDAKIVMQGPQPNPDAKLVMPGPQPNPEAKLVIPGSQSNPDAELVLPPRNETITAASLAEEASKQQTAKQNTQQNVQEQQGPVLQKAA